MEQIGNFIPESSMVALLLIEHVWAESLAGAIKRADGSVLARSYVSPELMEEVESLVAATSTVIERTTPPSPRKPPPSSPPSSTSDYDQRRAA